MLHVLIEIARNYTGLCCAKVVANIAIGFYILTALVALFVVLDVDLYLECVANILVEVQLLQCLCVSDDQLASLIELAGLVKVDRQASNTVEGCHEREFVQKMLENHSPT